MQHFKAQLESVLFWLCIGLLILAIYVAVVGAYPTKYQHPRKAGAIDVLVLCILATAAGGSGFALRRLRKATEGKTA